MSKCQKCQSFWKVIHAYAHIHAYIHTHHARENYWHFDILTFLEFILLIFNVLIDLQKLHFWFFIFASPNFCKSKLLSLTWGKQITLTGWKTEYLALAGTKRFLGKILWRDELRAAAGKFGGNLTVLAIFLGIGFAYIGKKQYLCSNPIGGFAYARE